VRYFLLREGRLDGDSDFSSQLMQQRCAKECADTFGNLGTRILNRLFMPLNAAALVPGLRLALPWASLRAAGVGAGAGRSGGTGAGAGAGAGGAAEWARWESELSGCQELPLSAAQIALLAQAAPLRAAADAGYSSAEPGAALEAITALLQAANGAYSDAQPWKVKPAREDVARWAAWAEASAGGAGAPTAPLLSADNLRLAACVYATLESLRVAAVLLQPAMPDCAPRLLRALGLGAEHARLTAWASAAPGLALPHHYRPDLSGPPLILFPKPAFRAADAAADAAPAAGAGTGAVPMSRKAKARAAKAGGGAA
jgi:hypothetical protein